MVGDDQIRADLQRLVNDCLREVDTQQDALDALAAAGHVSATTVAELHAAYVFLRAVEHRLQMLADQQKLSVDVVTKARDELGINPDKANPRLI